MIDGALILDSCVHVVYVYRSVLLCACVGSDAI